MKLYSNAQGDTSSPLSPHSSSHYFLLFIYLVVVIRIWIMQLGTSLWLDETLTYWNVMKGVSEVLPRSAVCAGQFQLYMLITALSAKLFGLNEIGLRIPSLIASFGSSWLMFRLGRRFSDTETGIFAAILFVCMPEISFYAYNARPYSLMIFCSLWAVWQLVQLHDTGAWRHVVGYAVAAAAMIYIHYISLPFLIVMVIYSVLQPDNKIFNTYHRAIVAHTLTFILIAPLVYIILVHGKDTASLSFTGTPNIYNYIQSVFSNYVLFVIISVIACKIFLNLRLSDFSNIYNKYSLFIILWFLVPVTTLYLVSVLTDYKLFISRYYSLSFPALTLMQAAILQKIRHDMFRYVLITACCIVGIFYAGNGGIKVESNEDWRGALNKVNEITESTKVPLFFNSGLVETLQPGWELQTANHHLLSPLSSYPVNTRVVALPVKLDDKSRPYLEKYITKEITAVNKFIVVLRTASNSGSVDKWIHEYSTPKGFNRREIGNFNGVMVVLYEQTKQNLT